MIVPSHSRSVSQWGSRDVPILRGQDWALPEAICAIDYLPKLFVMPSSGSILSGHLIGGLMKKGCTQPFLHLEKCRFPATTSDGHRPQDHRMGTSHMSRQVLGLIIPGNREWAPGRADMLAVLQSMCCQLLILQFYATAEALLHLCGRKGAILKIPHIIFSLWY